MATLTARAMTRSDIYLFNYWYSKRKYHSRIVRLCKKGVVIENDGRPILGAQLQANDGFLAAIHSIVSDPESEKSLRAESHKMAMQYLENLAKSMGYWGVSTAANIESLRGRYQDMGYVVKEEFLTLYVKEI